MKRCLGAVLALLLTTTAAHGADDHWTAAWGAPPDSAGPALAGKTIRQVVRPGIAGSALRIRLSNLFGTAPVVIGPVHVGLHDGGARVRPGTGHALTFAGGRTVTIPAGASVLSDALDMAVPALQDLAVSLYLPGSVPVSTVHGVGMQTAFLAGGDVTAADTFKPDSTDDSRYFLTDVEVVPAREAQAFVVFGDSIADGVGAGLDKNARWTDALAARLQHTPDLASIAVVNAGIAGNRIVNDASDPFVGPSGLARFGRDALDKAGVRWVFIHEGINDITASHLLADPRQHVSIERIVDGIRTLVARARRQGLRVWAGTALPFEGSRMGERAFYSNAADAERHALNEWIRTAGIFDAVVDFDRALRDPAHPARLAPRFDSGDHLHPNAAGYEVMAGLIDLDRLRGDQRRQLKRTVSFSRATTRTASLSPQR